MAKSSSKSSSNTKTQTYPNAQAAIAGAVKRGEPSITFKLPSSGKSKSK